MCTNIFSHRPPKVQSVRLSGGSLEGEGVITCLYVVGQGVSVFGRIVWIGFESFLMVEKLIWKNLFF